jgi:hypothetical protein
MMATSTGTGYNYTGLWLFGGKVYFPSVSLLASASTSNAKMPVQNLGYFK